MPSAGGSWSQLSSGRHDDRWGCYPWPKPGTGDLNPDRLAGTATGIAESRWQPLYLGQPLYLALIAA